MNTVFARTLLRETAFGAPRAVETAIWVRLCDVPIILLYAASQNRLGPRSVRVLDWA